MSEMTRFLSFWQAWQYYLPYVALLLIYVGLTVGSVRENLGLIPPPVLRHSDTSVTGLEGSTDPTTIQKLSINKSFKMLT